MLSFRRSLQWRLIMLFLLITISLMIFMGVSLNKSVESSFYNNFKKDVERGFKNWTIKDNPTEKEILKNLVEEKYAIILFTTNNKSCTVYNRKTEKIIWTSDTANYNIENVKELSGYRSELLKSENMIAALAKGAGDRGKLVRSDDKAFFDYASAKGDFILYFRYYREEWFPVVNEFNTIILSSSMIAIVLSLIIGFILSKTITIPIVSIMYKARKIAAGNFDQELPVKSDDEIGKLTKTFNFMANELKHTLIEISSEKNKIETILNYLTDGVVAFNLKGDVIHINPAARKMLGIDELDSTFNEFCSRFDLDITLEEIFYLKLPSGKEYDIRTNDKFIRTYFALFTDEAKKVEGIIAVLQDITEHQKVENMRREFVENVSHELRTPLTSIKSYAETLLDGAMNDGETAERFLGVINAEADRMTRLVRDLLQLSTINNRQMQWNMESIPFAELVKSSVEKIRIEAQNKNQVLESYVIGDIPNISADRDKIEQVVLNILSNAIKYTPARGEITVYVGRLYSDVYIKVADTGIGIPQKDLPRVFERFFRVDKARSREMGGTGLGLSIAREIVEYHGGTISINSEHGKGTEVIVKLPVAQVVTQS